MTRDPLLLRPQLHRRPWGGDRLPAWFGADAELASGYEPVGEAWLLGPDSTVASGPHAGRTLRALAEEGGAPLLGSAVTARYGDRVPLLAKFLDAGAWLSVQVHPDDAYARERHPERADLGKTESWLVLEAEPDARIQWGFRTPVTSAEVRAAAADGSLPELLRELAVAAGDVIHNPAGTVHALGPGVLAFELQQASDLTYRLFDGGRLGADGQPRALHLDDALAVADLRGEGTPRPPAGPVEDGWETLVRCDAYRLERVSLDGPCEGRVSGASFHALTVAEGAATLESDGASLPLARGATALVPAGPGGYRLEGRGTVLRGRLPEAS